jgi:hypothetical protein
MRAGRSPRQWRRQENDGVDRFGHERGHLPGHALSCESYKDVFAKRAADCRVSAATLATELGLGEFLH